MIAKGMSGQGRPTSAGIDIAAFASIYSTGGTPTASSVTVGIIAEGNLAATLNDLNKFAVRRCA
jgi:hypothetical protein